MVWRSLIALFTSAIVSFAAPARAQDLPTNVCAEDFCSPSQKVIWRRFQEAGKFDQKRLPAMYSGICYYAGLHVDPDAPQYAGLYLDQTAGQVHFDGRFSFFKKQNPYGALTLTTARDRFPQKHALALAGSFAYADLSDTFVPIHYWMRHDPKAQELLLVGYFGFRKTFLCALDRHPA